MDEAAGLRYGSGPGRWVLAATIAGSGMAMLDATVVTIALSRMGRELGASFGQLQWIVNAYTLTLAALILLGGSLGDTFGRRRVFVLGTIWFAAASALCALSPTVEVLIAARALQGVGAALLTPGSLAIISASFASADRARAIGAWSGLGGVAGALGPFLGGWLVELNWRLIFLLNLPLAAAVVAVSVRHVPETRDPQGGHAIDWGGVAGAALGLGGLTYALTAAGSGQRGPAVWGALALAAAGFVLFVVVERRAQRPLVPFGLFADGVFLRANVATLLIYSALGVFFFLLVLQLQVVSGFSPLVAGTSMLPVTVLMLLLSARMGALGGRIGPRLPMAVGCALASIGFALCLRIGPDAAYVTDVLPPAVLLGLGLACAVAPLTSAVLAAAPDHLAGTASGINNAVARSAGLLAVAVIPAAAGLSGYADPVAFDAGFQRAMLIGAGLLAVAAAVSLSIRAPGMAPATESERIDVGRMSACPVGAPQLHPRDEHSASSARPDAP